MRILLLSLLFIVSTLFAKEDINRQIKKTSTEIKSFDKSEIRETIFNVFAILFSVSRVLSKISGRL